MSHLEEFKYKLKNEPEFFKDYIIVEIPSENNSGDLYLYSLVNTNNKQKNSVNYANFYFDSCDDIKSLRKIFENNSIRRYSILWEYKNFVINGYIVNKESLKYFIKEDSLFKISSVSDSTSIFRFSDNFLFSVEFDLDILKNDLDEDDFMLLEKQIRLFRIRKSKEFLDHKKESLEIAKNEYKRAKEKYENVYKTLKDDEKLLIELEDNE